MKLSDFDDNDLNLFTALLVGEAGGEDAIGKLAVACVVRNRVLDGRWPNTYKAVILQENQFSCFNSIKRETEISDFWMHKYFTHHFQKLWWRECRASAHLVLCTWYNDITHGANHYYAPKLIEKPYWANDYEPCFVWGGHDFYKL